MASVPDLPPAPFIVTRMDRPPIVDHEVSIVSGAGASEVVGGLIQVPVQAVFVDRYGDVDLTLVFREVPATAAGFE